LKSDKSILVLEVKDNGVGITPEKISSQCSLGLLGMRERASMLGGRIAFSGKQSIGTAMTLTMPLQNVMKSEVPL